MWLQTAEARVVLKAWPNLVIQEIRFKAVHALCSTAVASATETAGLGWKVEER